LRDFQAAGKVCSLDFSTQHLFHSPFYPQIVLQSQFRRATVRSMALYPNASLSRADVIRLFGDDYQDVRYAAEPCLGKGGIGPMYESPNGDVEHLEYRHRGIAAAFQLTKVEAILYVDRAFGPLHSRCRGRGAGTRGKRGREKGVGKKGSD
jgi:hypothetical protein